MTIGDRIKVRRTELKLSQRELCQKMGYSNHSTIGKIEAGKVDIPQSRVVQFSEVLGVSIAYLMGWEEEIAQNPVGTAERHTEILKDEDFVGMYDDFKTLDKKERKRVSDLVHSLADAKKR